MNTTCPICGDKKTSVQDIGFCKYYTCPSCGMYNINRLAFSDDDLKNLTNKHLLAGYLYETKSDREALVKAGTDLPPLNHETILQYISSSKVPKTSIEKLDKLLLNSYNLEDVFSVSIPVLNPALGYAKNIRELTLMNQRLIEMGYLDQQWQITGKGLEHIKLLLDEHPNTDSKQVFIAMKFNNPKLDSVCESAIKPTCAKFGFKANVVSDFEYLGSVDDKILSSIKESRFVIADFTENNNGVYYEAGYAEGLRIPVIKTCEKKFFDESGAHFDINHDNFILWDDEFDLIEKLKSKIRVVIM